MNSLNMFVKLGIDTANATIKNCRDIKSLKRNNFFIGLSIVGLSYIITKQSEDIRALKEHILKEDHREE